MKKIIEIEKLIDLKYLQINAFVRYWEDTEVNGEPDTENGDNIPCKVGSTWRPKINIDNGIIENWEQGKTANVHYKVCDACSWELIDDEGNEIHKVVDEYVPSILYPKENGYGDYIIMDIDENGVIEDWEATEKLINDLLEY